MKSHMSMDAYTTALPLLAKSNTHHAFVPAACPPWQLASKSGGCALRMPRMCVF